ncbi:MAG: DUF1573 domain-containing protein [Planctomycetes bacterium]|nr:DUF1573 domain-containing protein [Planctomycetota bacterium]
MKTFASLATLLTVVVLAVGARLTAISHPDATAATLRPSSEAEDFGTVAPAQHLQGGLSVYNAGSRRLILHQNGAACCGQAAPEPLIVAPGQTASVPIDVSAPTQPGPFQQLVSFTTNDPSRPRFEFVVRGFVGQRPGE